MRNELTNTTLLLAAERHIIVQEIVLVHPHLRKKEGVMSERGNLKCDVNVTLRVVPTASHVGAKHVVRSSHDVKRDVNRRNKFRRVRRRLITHGRDDMIARPSRTKQNEQNGLTVPASRA